MVFIVLISAGEDGDVLSIDNVYLDEGEASERVKEIMSSSDLFAHYEEHEVQ